MKELKTSLSKPKPLKQTIMQRSLMKLWLKLLTLLIKHMQTTKSKSKDRFSNLPFKELQREEWTMPMTLFFHTSWKPFKKQYKNSILFPLKNKRNWLFWPMIRLNQSEHLMPDLEMSSFKMNQKSMELLKLKKMWARFSADGESDYC